MNTCCARQYVVFVPAHLCASDMSRGLANKDTLTVVLRGRLTSPLLFMSMGWDYVSELRPPTGLLFTPHPHMVYEYVATVEWYGQAKPKISERNKSLCHSFHHKPTYNYSGANPCFRGERPATNRLMLVTAQRVFDMGVDLFLISFLYRRTWLLSGYVFIVHCPVAVVRNYCYIVGLLHSSNRETNVCKKSITLWDFGFSRR
jgi:hypothetical protein